MKQLAIRKTAKYLALTVALLGCAETVRASAASESSDGLDNAGPVISAFGAGLANSQSLFGASSIAPIPSSSNVLHNPYVLFADVLALEPQGNQTNALSQIFYFDALNFTPAANPNPVPLPESLLLLLSGLGVLVVSSRRRNALAL